MKRFETILDGSLPRECGVEAIFSFEHLAMGTGVIDEIGPYVSKGNYQRVLVVSDRRTQKIAGHSVTASLEKSGVEFREWVLADSDTGESPCADDGTVEAAVEESKTADLLISVGSGTVNDVVKMAATRNEIPFLAVPTAASMNGYTSAIAAILSNGVKRTLPTVQVTGIFADVDILAEAPAEMTLAGFGDLVSKPFSNACWYLSARMTGGTRSEAPSRLLDEPFRELLTHAKGIGEKEVEAVAALTETLLLSGCAMALAGSSSPASGGEHLLSHYWDMVAHANHRPLRGLHGTQVGIATLITGRLYEGMLHANEGYSSVSERMEVYPSSSEMMAEGVRKRHPDLPHGIREEVVAQALQKYLPPQEQRERLYTLERDWPEIREDLLGMLMPTQDIEDALRAAGAPVRAEEIGVDLKTLQDTVAVARDIRSRYTILDFASDMGVLESYCDMLAGAP